MGAMNFFGNFLKGYTESRQNKERMKLAEQSESMNMARQWADIADRASGPGGDAIREMATRNMQDIIVKHEKESGEKHGLGAILKFFKKDKKDTPSMLNKIAPMLSKRIEPQGEQLSTSISERVDQPQMNRTQLSPDDVQTSATLNRDGTVQGPDEFMDVPMEPNKPTPELTYDSSGSSVVVDKAGSQMDVPINSEGQSPISQIDKYGATNKAAVENAQRISGLLAPGKSVFFPQYSGGTRYSPTWAESEAAKIDMADKEDERKAKRALENAEKIADAQEGRRKKFVQQNIQDMKNSPVWATLPKTKQDRLIFEVETNTKVPDFTKEELEITGPPEFKNGTIVAKNRIGEDMNIEEDWRKAHPEAAQWLDLQKNKDKSIPEALRQAAEFKQSEDKIENQLKRAQIARIESADKREKEQIDREERILRQTNQQHGLTILKQVEKNWDDELKRLKSTGDAISGIGNERSVEERITGRKPDGTPSYIFKPFKDKNGNPYKSLQDYKDAWMSSQIPGGIDVNRYRYFVMTGKDPFQEIPGSMGFGPGWESKNKGSQIPTVLPPPPGANATPKKEEKKVENPDRRSVGNLMDSKKDRESLLQELGI